MIISLGTKHLQKLLESFGGFHYRKKADDSTLRNCEKVFDPLGCRGHSLATEPSSRQFACRQLFQWPVADSADGLSPDLKVVGFSLVEAPWKSWKMSTSILITMPGRLRPNSWSQHSHYIPVCWVPDLVQGETGPIFDGESHYLGLLGSLLSLIVDLRELAQNGDLKQSLGWNPQFTQLAITWGILSILHFSTNQCFAGSHSSTTCSTAGPVTKP